MPTVLEKAFVIGPGHAPTPHKLVKKTTGGHFLDLVDFLLANFRARENEPQTFLDCKLVVSAPKHLVVEVLDILTRTEAFSI